jgi:hypothetical protein
MAESLLKRVAGRNGNSPMSTFMGAATLLVAAMLVFSTARDARAQQPTTSVTETARIEGTWQGTLSLPTARLRLVVKIRRDATSGALSGSMDSLDQGARDLPIDSLHFENGRLVFEMRAIGGRYEGRLSDSGDELVGDWSQRGATLPLTLKRDSNVPVAKRPQEPSLPLPYREEEVAYDSAPGVRLAATFTLPAGDGPFPCVVLLTGSGPQDRDESIAGHRPFYVLADALTRRGIAVLRADDRGVGGSTGNFSATSSSEEFATDALAGVRFLTARPDIQRGRIGLIGHSEGALVASLAATRDLPEARSVGFLVLLAGPGVPLGDVLLEQTRLILGSRGIPPQVLDAETKALARLIEIALTEGDRERAASAMRAVINERIGALPEAAREPMERQVEQQVAQMNSPWMRWMLAYDPALILQATRIPVLAVFGGRDLQVPAAQNKGPVEFAIRTAGHPASKVVEVPDVNHLFQAATTGAPVEYGQIEETMNPAVLDLIGDWVLDRVNSPSGD